MALSSITKTAPSLPSRVIFFAGEKWGKSSLAAYFPSCVFQMTQGESGLLTLIESGQVPETPHFPEAECWPDIVRNAEDLLHDPHDYRVYVQDTLNGAENQLISHVCQSRFGGNIKRFNQYGDGMKVCVPMWAEFLGLLDALRLRRKMAIALLAHCKVKDTTNADGDNYAQNRPECNEKLYSLTHKWADVIAFGGWDFGKDGLEDGKVDTAKSSRMIFTDLAPTRVAGNRYGMETNIAGVGPQGMSRAFLNAIVKAKAAGKKTELPPPPAAMDEAAEAARRKKMADDAIADREKTAAAEKPAAASPQPEPAKPAPAAASHPAAAAEGAEERGDSYEPGPDDAPWDTPEFRKPAEAPAPAPSTAPAAEQAPAPAAAPAASAQPERASPAKIQAVIKQIKDQKLTWPKVRSAYAEAAGFPPAIPSVTELTSEQADRLIAALEAAAKKGASA